MLVGWIVFISFIVVSLGIVAACMVYKINEQSDEDFKNIFEHTYYDR